MALYHRGSATLSYGVRRSVMLRYLGELFVALTGLPAAPAVFALALGRVGEAVPYLVLMAGLGAAGLLMARVPATARLQKNEALVVTALTFIAASLAMSWPFSATAPHYVDALFESVSAITTTGLTTLPTMEGASPTFLFARSWAQWYGGLAIVALAVAIILEPGAVARRLAEDELASEDLAGGAQMRARRALFYYSGITVLGIVGLAVLGVPLHDSIVHVLSAVSTGGFSSHDESIRALGGQATYAVLSLLSLLGAVSFSLVVVAWRRGWRVIAEDPEVRLMILLIVLVALTLAAIQNWAAPEMGAVTISEALVLAVSAQTTTGFTPLAIAELSDGSKLTLIFSMAVGGDAGSTAGGIKLGRVVVLFSVLSLVLFRAALPSKAVTYVSVAGQRIEQRILESVVAITLMYCAVIAIGWFLFVLSGHAGIDALFDVVSAAATTGLSTGLTGPELAPGLKLVLCATMLMGRLEVVAILTLLYHRTWFAHRARSS